jgi:hypothetical protein
VTRYRNCLSTTLIFNLNIFAFGGAPAVVLVIVGTNSEPMRNGDDDSPVANSCQRSDSLG